MYTLEKTNRNSNENLESRNMINIFDFEKKKNKNTKILMKILTKLPSFHNNLTISELTKIITKIQ
jgi:hypothetical protein